jgi:4-amino-4-deoxy-L-arabinose transferase-like glycosyltransferase
MKLFNLKPAFAALIIALLNLASFLTLFNIRSIDDNRLTSWKWVFSDAKIANLSLILLAGFIIAYGISKLQFFKPKAILLLLISFVSAAMFWEEQETIVDATRYFTQAKHLKIYGIEFFIQRWGKDIFSWTDLPVVPLLYGLIIKFLGECRLYLQIFNTLLFSMTVGLTFMIGKTLWDENTGLYAGLLMLGIPYIFTQVPLMLVDVPTMFFLTLSIFAVIKALEQGGIWPTFLSCAALFIVIFSKYSAWLWLTVMIPIILVYMRDEPRLTFKRSSIIALITLLLIIIVFLYYSDVISEQIKLLIAYQRPGLRRWTESFVSTFFFQIHPLITIAAIYSIYVAVKKKDMKYAIVGYLIFLVIILQIKRIRYIIPLFPMIALMASYGLQELRNNETKIFMVFCIIIYSFTISYSAYLPFLQKISTVNIKHAGKFVNTLDVEGIEVITLPQKKSIINPQISVPLLDLYTDKRIFYQPNSETPQNWNKIKNSSLRFTWEFTNPDYYIRKKKRHNQSRAMVVISPEPDQPLSSYLIRKTQYYKHSKVFQTNTGLFRYKTVVTVYYN